MRARSGFSLVELSIVLVILGLLVGGILAGQSLVRAAEIRAVSTQYRQFAVAFKAFEEQYFAIPGDFAKATRFWGDDNAACPDPAVANGSPGACNGNGDSYLAKPTTVNQPSEDYQLWKHLALAGLIEGNYTGRNGPNIATGDAIIGSNVPGARINIGGWSANPGDRYWPGDAATFASYSDPGRITIRFGSKAPGGEIQGAILTSTEAWSIDNKSDDGMPATGNILLYKRAACSNSSSATDFKAEYKPAATGLQCALTFVKLL